MPRGTISQFVASLKLITSRDSLFANEQRDVNEDIQLFQLANVYSPEGGWVMLAPYGDWPNRQGMQRFHKPEAERIVANSFSSIHAKLLGIPFYVGHPDHPLFEGKPGHTDTKSHGRIKHLEARDDGLYANVKWGRSGKELIEDGAYHSVSVNWEMERDGAVFRPRSLKSVGLTNSPNIPVPPILSANEESKIMKKIALQLGLPETATEEQIAQKCLDMANESKTAQTTITALKAVETEYAGKKTEFANVQTELATAKGQVTTLTQQVTTLTTERDTAKTSFANERAAHTKVLLDAAEKAGRITNAERKTYETDFANATTFETTLTKLGAAKAGTGLPVRDGSRVEGNRQRVNDQAARQGKVLQFVNAKQTANPGMSYNTAFLAVQTENPDLFANMVQPEQD